VARESSAFFVVSMKDRNWNCSKMIKVRFGKMIIYNSLRRVQAVALLCAVNGVAFAEKYCPNPNCYYHTHRANDQNIMCIKDGMRLEESSPKLSNSPLALSSVRITRQFSNGQVLKYRLESQTNGTLLLGTRSKSLSIQNKETQTMYIDAVSSEGFKLRWTTSDIYSSSPDSTNFPKEVIATVGRDGSFVSSTVLQGKIEMGYLPLVFVPLPDKELRIGMEWKPDFGQTGMRLENILATITSINTEQVVIHLVGSIPVDYYPKTGPQASLVLRGDWTLYMNTQSGIVRQVRSTYVGSGTATDGRNKAGLKVTGDETITLLSY
jgi:hypothetical protein